MQSFTPLRLRPVIQRICCLNEAHRASKASKASASEINLNLLSNRIPEKPKKPGNSFLLFVQDVQTKIYADKPDASRREIIRTAGELWRNADGDIRKRYADLFSAKNEEYEKELETFRRNLTKEQESALAEIDKLKQEKKSKNNYRKVLKELGKPAKPPSAYGIFISEHKQKKKIDGETNRERFQRLADEWKYLPDDKKAVYIQKGQEYLKNFIHDTKEWEISMLKKLNLEEDEIESLMERDADKKPLTRSKKLSTYIYSAITAKSDKSAEEKK